MIYSIWDKADNILQSFNLSEEALESYKTVKKRRDLIPTLFKEGTLFLREQTLTAESKNQASMLMILLQIYTARQDTVIVVVSMKRWFVTELW